MDGVSELAKLFKQRDNIPYMGPQLGVVISSMPDIKVQLGDKIILGKENLIISAHVLADYTRDIKFDETSNLSGSTGISGSPYEHSHDYATLGFSGQVTFTDTLKPGNEVILIPSTDAQFYFLVDKAVRP